VLAGGDHGGFERGWFLAPTAVVDVDDSMELLRTETFGPVAPVQRVGSLDEAIGRANALPYGLGANVCTGPLDHVLRCMEELRAGTVRHEAVRQRPRAGPGGPGVVPGDQACPP
jgi:acyl-CoA reductase-like NAD-dependent aldehyde dehydrogenase